MVYQISIHAAGLPRGQNCRQQLEHETASHVQQLELENETEYRLLKM